MFGSFSSQAHGINQKNTSGRTPDDLTRQVTDHHLREVSGMQNAQQAYWMRAPTKHALDRARATGSPPIPYKRNLTERALNGKALGAFSKEGWRPVSGRREP